MQTAIQLNWRAWKESISVYRPFPRETKRTKVFLQPLRIGQDPARSNLNQRRRIALAKIADLVLKFYTVHNGNRPSDDSKQRLALLTRAISYLPYCRRYDELWRSFFLRFFPLSFNAFFFLFLLLFFTRKKYSQYPIKTIIRTWNKIQVHLKSTHNFSTCLARLKESSPSLNSNRNNSFRNMVTECCSIRKMAGSWIDPRARHRVE